MSVFQENTISINKLASLRDTWASKYVVSWSRGASVAPTVKGYVTLIVSENIPYLTIF